MKNSVALSLPRKKSRSTRPKPWTTRLFSSGTSLILGTAALLLLSATYSIIYIIVNTTLSDLVEHTGAPKYPVMWSSFVVVFISFIGCTLAWVRFVGEKNGSHTATPDALMVSLRGN
jgi:hypothetical protein